MSTLYTQYVHENGTLTQDKAVQDIKLQMLNAVM
jgi:hypothetical protein